MITLLCICSSVNSVCINRDTGICLITLLLLLSKPVEMMSPATQPMWLPDTKFGLKYICVPLAK